MQSPYHFFLKHAGYSHGKGETKQQGRIRCARRLADDERKARIGGFSYVWDVDPHSTSAEWIDDNEDGGRNCDPWQTWQCCMLNADGRIVASLHSIDFGRDGSPWGEPYKRVVEAELAADGLTNEPQNVYGQRS